MRCTAPHQPAPHPNALGCDTHQPGQWCDLGRHRRKRSFWLSAGAPRRGAAVSPGHGGSRGEKVCKSNPAPPQAGSASLGPLTLHLGHFSFSFRAMPVMVPPVPTEATSMSSFPVEGGEHSQVSQAAQPSTLEAHRCKHTHAQAGSQVQRQPHHRLWVQLWAQVQCRAGKSEPSSALHQDSSLLPEKPAGWANTCTKYQAN